MYEWRIITRTASAEVLVELWIELSLSTVCGLTDTAFRRSALRLWRAGALTGARSREQERSPDSAMSARVRRSQHAAQPGSARSPASGRHSPLKSPGGFQSPTRNLAPIGELASSPSLGASPGPGGRTRPRAGRRSTQKMDITGHQKSDHPLGSGGSGWNEQPKYQTPGQMWHDRWQTMQPHPSFDVDGDGVVSNVDYYLAKQFDRDNNGVLDQDEIIEMRKILTKKGTDAFHAMGHGPHVASLAAKTHSSLFDQTPRDMDPAKGIDPHSDQWHLQMKNLENKTAVQSGMSSDIVKKCVEHSDTEAGQINMMDEMVGQGVHQVSPHSPHPPQLDFQTDL